MSNSRKRYYITDSFGMYLKVDHSFVSCVKAQEHMTKDGAVLIATALNKRLKRVMIVVDENGRKVATVG